MGRPRSSAVCPGAGSRSSGSPGWPRSSAPGSAIAWPALGQLLVAYAVAARIPVAVVMLFAILAGWGTHYDAPPPVFPAMLPLRRWLWTGLLPQATIWVAYTVVVGMLFGVLGQVVASRRPPD